MSGSLVSVIIIFLNEERFLDEAIRSVESQTTDQWELILVDDGSSDRSAAIAEAAVARDPQRIRYATHPGLQNRGMSASRNLGIELAAGGFVAFLDGDDVWLPEKLERQLAVFEAHPEIAMTFGPLLRWLRWTDDPEAGIHEDLMGVGRKKRGRHKLGGRVVRPPELVPLMLRDDYFIPGGILVRREVLNEVGGYADEFSGMYEDAVAMSRVCLRHSVYIHDEIGYLYRMHPDSCTQTNSSSDEINRARARFLGWVESHLDESEIDDRSVRTALRRAQFPLEHPRFHGLLDGRRRRKSLVEAGRKLGRIGLPRPARDRLRALWQTRTQAPNLDPE